MVLPDAATAEREALHAVLEIGKEMILAGARVVAVEVLDERRRRVRNVRLTIRVEPL